MFEPSSADKNSFLELNSPLSPNNNQHFDDPLHPFSHPKNSNLALSSYPQLSELEISSATDTSLITSVQAASNLVREQLTKVALSPGYDEIIGLAFGENYDIQVANSIWQRFAQGDLSELPDIQVISSDILGNANGAYGKEVDTIFLSDDFVRNHNTQEIAGVLTEEIGHYIDGRINTVDAAGDEGDIFSRLVGGESLSGADLALLKEEDDSAVIWLNGQEVAIEKNDTLSTAYNIGTLSGSRSFSDWVGSADTNDYYRFYVGSQSNFSLGLTGLTADADVQLLNSSGSVITSSTASGNSNESINRQLGTGTYYVRVLPYSGANTNYSLNLSGVSLSSQVRSGSENVNLWLYDTNGRNTTGYINPNRETVVVIHGWNNSDQSSGINRLAREAAEFGTQVLALDWGGIANDPDELDSWPLDAVPDETAQWITPVARWASNLLGNLGIASNQLTLIGHSLGTYVASEIGRIGGTVRNLVALDPANNPNDNEGLYYLDNSSYQRPVRFDSVAQYSLSFVVGDLDHGLAGNNNQAATAHDSFVINDWGQYWSSNLPDVWAHGAVVDLFTNALDRRLLFPTNLTMPSHQDNWYNNNGDRNNRNNGQHEGYINASWVNNNWQIAGLRRVIDSSGTEVLTWT